MNIPYIPLLIAVVITGLMLTLVRPFAVRIGLVDHPGGRKRHNGATPMIGGLVMLLGFVVSILVSPIDLNEAKYLLLFSLIMMVVGVLDDYHDISVGRRFLLQGIVALIMASGAGVTIYSLGDLVGTGMVELSDWAIPITVLSVLGVVNALNMSDGIDGLAGTLSLVTFLSIAYLAFLAGNELHLTIALLFSAVLLPFLSSNLCIFSCRGGKVFMGDSGGMFLGFGISWLLIDLSQGEGAAFAPITALWLFSVPLMDTVVIMLRRVMKGRSPFVPDRQHIHHFFMRIGLSDRQALLVIVIFALIMAIIGIWAELQQVAEWKMFVAFLVVSLIYFIGTMCAWKMVKLLRRIVLT